MPPVQAATALLLTLLRSGSPDTPSRDSSTHRNLRTSAAKCSRRGVRDATPRHFWRRVRKALRSKEMSCRARQESVPSVQRAPSEQKIMGVHPGSFEQRVRKWLKRREINFALLKEWQRAKVMRAWRSVSRHRQSRWLSKERG